MACFSRSLRLTYGSTHLLTGFDFLVAVIGLFGIGEILLTLEEGLAFKGAAAKLNMRVVMEVSDDGVGPLSPAGERGQSLGWKLVLAFARQLNAEVSVTHERGTTVCVTFPFDSEDSRSTENRSLYVEPSNGSP